MVPGITYRSPRRIKPSNLEISNSGNPCGEFSYTGQEVFGIPKILGFFFFFVAPFFLLAILGMEKGPIVAA